MNTLIFLAILLSASSCMGQCTDEYTVVAGDTCGDITFNNRISTDDFLAINPGLDCDNLQEGQQVCIAENIPIDPITMPDDCSQIYTVIAGDTCLDISFNNRISTYDFLAMNSGINCDNLQAGQQVCLAVDSSMIQNGVASEENQNLSVEEQNSIEEEQSLSEEVQIVNEEEQNVTQEEQISVEEELNPSEEEQISNETELNPTEEELNLSEEVQNTSEEALNPTEEVENNVEENEILDPFAEEVIAAHQVYRDKYGSPRLTWNYTLNTSATQWAQYLAENNLMIHTTDFSYGENIAGTNGASYAPTYYVDTWGAEGKYFVEGSIIFNEAASTTGNLASIGHYTQVIWKTTTSVGCGMITVGDITRFVCQYYPSGNALNRPMI